MRSLSAADCSAGPFSLALRLGATFCAALCGQLAEGRSQEAAPEPAWIVAEAARLSHQVQLTFPQRFLKAGEAYFSPDGRMIVFQAIERPAEGVTADEFYGMYVADLKGDAPGEERLENIRRVSPPRSANTCGWFDAARSGSLIFASTVTPPTGVESPGYQRGTGRYRWAFPAEMRVVRVRLDRADGTALSLQPVTGDGKGYVAECSTSADGKWLVYCSLTSGDGNIFVKELATDREVPLVMNRGYDGGPFFSPDGKRICYRSDRQGNDLLQVFVADLEFAPDGAIKGAINERQLTDNEYVNWGPFWHPDGKRLVYASSQMGHQNYEVFEIDVPAAGQSDGVEKGGDSAAAECSSKPVPRRVTNAEGADVLPAFDATGKRFLWTSKRGSDATSQLWIAEYRDP
ncbi:MAG: hypothetical protein EXS00_00795 [Phycisphaerales bacterium]|nr:hypothetical protein [Phycisphaerales bacterium]